MTIVKATSGLRIPPHPEGQFPARMIDFFDAGMQKQTFRGRERMAHRGLFRFYAGETFTMSDKENEGREIAKPLWLDIYFTLTLSENGSLRPFLESWRGVKFTPEQVDAGMDMEVLIDVPALIQVTQKQGRNRIYANLSSIMKLPKSMAEDAPGTPDGYTRIKDRPQTDRTPLDPQDAANAEDLDDLPF